MFLSKLVVFVSLIASTSLAAPRFAEAGGAGALDQLDGQDGCVAKDDAEGCAVARALDMPDAWR